jgi:Ohr subfamily peroxiredoxin
MKMIYRTKASADGGRAGKVVNEEAGLALDLSPPGGAAKGNNPEQLFAMGYAACFDSALKLSAKLAKADMKGSRTTVDVGLGQEEGGGYALDVEISVTVRGLPEAEARRLVAQAHEVCPYSKALRGNVAVRLNVNVE